MKEKFTPDEWDRLKTLPFHVFGLVAGADQKIDKKEIERLVMNLQTADSYKDPLHRELFAEIFESDLNVLLSRELEHGSNFLEQASQIKRILREKLTSEEYKRFVASMYIYAVGIADASGGGGFFKKKSRISEEEKQALSMFHNLYEVDPQSIKQWFIEE